MTDNGHCAADENGFRNGVINPTFGAKTTFSLKGHSPNPKLYEDLVKRHAHYGELSDFTLAKRIPKFQGVMYAKEGAEYLMDQNICMATKRVYHNGEKKKSVYECIISDAHAKRLGLPRKVARKSMPVERYTVTDAFALRRCHEIKYVPDLYLVQSNGEKVFIYMEFIEGQNFRQEEVNKWERHERKTLCRELIAVVKAIHELDIVHYDIKPSNLMVYKGDGPTVLHIIDFGSSKMYGFPYIVHNHSLTNTTPEMDKYKSYEEKVKKVDVYQLGLVFLFVETGRDRLFLEELAKEGIGTEDISEVRNKYIEWISALTEEKLEECLGSYISNHSQNGTHDREKLTNLLRKMLNPDPDKRPSLEEVMEDMYFQGESEGNQERVYSRTEMEDN